MKVQVPFDFDMDERFGIALAESGELRLATREECRAWVHAHIDPQRADLRGTVQALKDRFNTVPTPPAKEE